MRLFGLVAYTEDVRNARRIIIVNNGYSRNSIRKCEQDLCDSGRAFVNMVP